MNLHKENHLGTAPGIAVEHKQLIVFKWGKERIAENYLVFINKFECALLSKVDFLRKEVSDFIYKRP